MTASLSAAPALGYQYEIYVRPKLTKWQLQRVAARLLPENGRLSGCCAKLKRHHNQVKIMAQGDRLYYAGVMRCGSIWLCPVCAGRVSEVRREEVQLGIDNAIAGGLGVSLITLTIRHGLDDPIGELLPRITKALSKLKSGRAYKDLRHDFGLIGDIRALEITHGKNGWHPHTHAISISHAPLKGHDLVRLKRRLFVLWYPACRKAGLPLPDYKHGVDIRGARYAALYMAKWGFANEIAKPQLKRARNGGRNPWELLVDAADGDKKSAWLWRDFAQNFEGKRQLYWSPGLKKRLEIRGEITDQEVLDLDDTTEGRVQVCSIDEDTWAVVLRGEARGQVLDAAQNSQQDLFGYLNHLRCTVPLWDGSILGPREDWC